MQHALRLVRLNINAPGEIAVAWRSNILVNHEGALQDVGIVMKVTCTTQSLIRAGSSCDKLLVR